MDDMADYVSDVELSFAPMAALGWRTQMVSWRATDVDWNHYDAVYICTPWDYPQDPSTFLEVLQRIEDSKAVLVNPLPLVRWTLEKSYLRELEARGANIVPSRWYEDFDRQDVRGFFIAHGTDKVVIKPLVGASAGDTFVLEDPVGESMLASLAATFAGRAFIVQAFIENIAREGEFSLFYFGGELSHTILKTPQAGDFRVQEELGGSIRSVKAEPALVAAASELLERVEPQPVYARIDYVRGDDGRFLLMELELIEPSLYLRMDDGAAMRFATAVDAYVRQHAA
jgi:glutathione synthase/RimK-type ligase-like ATP-grasp enzyme